MVNEEQLGFPLENMGAVSQRQSAHDIRLELNALLDRARAARPEIPWDMETHRRYRALVPEKVKALPPEEAEFLRRQFVLEFERIELLLVA